MSEQSDAEFERAERFQARLIERNREYADLAAIHAELVAALRQIDTMPPKDSLTWVEVANSYSKARSIARATLGSSSPTDRV